MSYLKINWHTSTLVERNQIGVINMKKLFLKLFEISCTIAGLYAGYLLSQHIFSIFTGGDGLFLWIALVCVLIWFGRHNKDGFYRLFKDIHQSNLDDIERQELDEQKKVN